MTLYDRIASIYDPWSRSVTEDVEFYVERALAAGGPVVELAVGTGRIAIPVARAGVDVIGVDSSPAMLEVARAAAEDAGVSDRVDLRLGDLREPPVQERVALVICPFRSLLHMETEDEKLRALRGARSSSSPAAASSSTSSRRAARTSRRRTDAGSSASRGSSSAPTGTRAGARCRCPSGRTTGRRRPSACTGSPPPSGSAFSTRRSSTSRPSTAGSTDGHTTATRTWSSSRGVVR